MNRILKLTSDHLPEILDGVGIASTIAADICFVVLPKKLIYDKPEKKRTKKDYAIAYGVPIGLSGLSVGSFMLSGQKRKKENIALLGANAALMLAQDKYKKAVYEEVDNDTLAKIEGKVEELSDEAMMIESDSLDEQDAPAKIERRRYYFKQFRLTVWCCPDQIDAAITDLNNKLYNEGEASVEWFFNRIDPDLKNREAYKRAFGDDADILGWKDPDPDPSDEYSSAVTIVTYIRTMSDGIDTNTIQFVPQPLYYEEWDAYYEDLWREYEERSSFDYQEKT